MNARNLTVVGILTVVFSLIVTLVLGACMTSSSTERPAPKKVLFIGNSIIYYNDLPGMFKKLAESKGHAVETGESTMSSYRISDHLKRQDTLAKIDSARWDLVVANESAYALTEEENYAVGLYDPMEKFTAIMRSRNLKMALMTNPAFRYGYEIGGMMTYEIMQDRIVASSEEVARRNGFDLIPTAIAWRKLYDMNTSMDLWNSDSIHPVSNTTYLFACTIYAYMFNESPVGARYRPKDMSSGNAKMIQKLAYDTMVAYRQPR